MSTSSSAVIEVVADSDDLNNGSDSDIQEVQQQQMDILKSKLAQNKKASSNIRLTRKVKDESDEVPSATRNFLKLRETAKKRTDMSKSTQLLFKVTVNLQKPAGQKVGTCVPAQSRGFEFEDVRDRISRIHSLTYLLCRKWSMFSAPWSIWFKNGEGDGNKFTLAKLFAGNSIPSHPFTLLIRSSGRMCTSPSVVGWTSHRSTDPRTRQLRSFGPHSRGKRTSSSRNLQSQTASPK